MIDDRIGSLLPATVALVVGAVGVRHVVLKRRKSKEETPPNKLRVYGFLPLPPDPDSSPSCIKLLTFLKMTQTEYEYVGAAEHNLKLCPKGKLPYAFGAVLGSKPVGDSTLIIDALMRSDPKKYNLDSHLSKRDHAIGTALKIMLEESCYFNNIVYPRWGSDDQFNNITVPTYFASIPSLLRSSISKMIRKKVLRDLKGHGTGLLEEEEIIAKATKEIGAFSELLGSSKYVLGSQISSYDSTAYAYAAGFIHGDWNHPITEISRGHENIVKYVERMRKEFWPELQG